MPQLSRSGTHRARRSWRWPAAACLPRCRATRSPSPRSPGRRPAGACTPPRAACSSAPGTRRPPWRPGARQPRPVLAQTQVPRPSCSFRPCASDALAALARSRGLLSDRMGVVLLVPPQRHVVPVVSSVAPSASFAGPLVSPSSGSACGGCSRRVRAERADVAAPPCAWRSPCKRVEAGRGSLVEQAAVRAWRQTGGSVDAAVTSAAAGARR